MIRSSLLGIAVFEDVYFAYDSGGFDTVLFECEVAYFDILGGDDRGSSTCRHAG